MQKVYIDWNISNWITIVLMFIVAMLLVNAVAVGYNMAVGNNAA